jgi:hypothetical protein
MCIDPNCPSKADWKKKKFVAKPKEGGVAQKAEEAGGS